VVSIEAEFSSFASHKVLGLLSEKHQAPGTAYQDTCSQTASEILEALLTEGRDASLMVIQGTLMADSQIDNETRELLLPKLYEGLRWGVHIVAVADGFVYDPMLKRPLPQEAYSKEAFKNNVVETYIVVKGTSSRNSSLISPLDEAR